jgi:hypothetical protein
MNSVWAVSMASAIDETLRHAVLVRTSAASRRSKPGPATGHITRPSEFMSLAQPFEPN